MSVGNGLSRTLALACLLGSAECRRDSARQGQAAASDSRSPPARPPSDGPVAVSLAPASAPLASETESAARGRTPPPGPAAPELERAVALVTVKLLVTPPKLAHVFWGVKDLGVAPLELHRPRGSGPMDIVLRAPGFLAHHTRVFTDHDDTLSIRLGPENEGARYFGYQVPVEKAASYSKAKPGTKPTR